MPNEQEEWRKFLQPVITGLAAFLSAAVVVGGALVLLAL